MRFLVFLLISLLFEVVPVSAQEWVFFTSKDPLTSKVVGNIGQRSKGGAAILGVSCSPRGDAGLAVLFGGRGISERQSDLPKKVKVKTVNGDDFELLMLKHSSGGEDYYASMQKYEKNVKVFLLRLSNVKGEVTLVLNGQPTIFDSKGAALATSLLIDHCRLDLN